MIKSIWRLLFPKNYKDIYAKKKDYIEQLKSYKLPINNLTEFQKLQIIKSDATHLSALVKNGTFTSKDLFLTFAERS